MKYYIISDTHFEHKAIIDYCDRPENHENILFSNLKKIPAKDCLIHLDDIGIGKDLRLHQKCIEPLKCRKILTMGNHDSKSYSWYMNHGWDFVCESFRLKYGGKNILFAHKPQVWDGEWDLNIHGHLHNLSHRRAEYKELREWHRIYAPETQNYKPIELTKFVATP